ncbi:MAG: ACT domain-containing protein [Phycisphaerae bacterium]|nr:ACT domain-containing protein [Phycisphaerae bacterium]MDW8261223.1 ACT domain-containing protein [Phycisphaerales bacterium]
MNLTLTILPQKMAICRFQRNHWPGPWWLGADFFSLTQTEDELSIICDEQVVPRDVNKVERGWRTFKVVGPLDFGLVGILAELSAVLARANIPIISISTHDTDHILVRDVNLKDATEALRKAGFTIQ